MTTLCPECGYDEPRQIIEGCTIAAHLPSGMSEKVIFWQCMKCKTVFVTKRRR